nr:protein STICHEL-like 3 [Tanacetum cinerariifolium]
MLVEEDSCHVYDTDNEEEESMPVYDIDIEDVVEEEKGFVGIEESSRRSLKDDSLLDAVNLARDIYPGTSSHNREHGRHDSLNRGKRWKFKGRGRVPRASKNKMSMASDFIDEGRSLLCSLSYSKSKSGSQRDSSQMPVMSDHSTLSLNGESLPLLMDGSQDSMENRSAWVHNYSGELDANTHDFIVKFPDGYDPNIGQFRVQLSGGQKQSGLIYVLQSGKLIEIGSHDELMQTDDSHYFKMVQLLLSASSTKIHIPHRRSVSASPIRGNTTLGKSALRSIEGNGKGNDDVGNGMGKIAGVLDGGVLDGGAGMKVDGAAAFIRTIDALRISRLENFRLVLVLCGLFISIGITYTEAPLGYRAAGIRSTRGFRADYGFVGTLDSDIRRDSDREVGYRITDVWVDPTKAAEEIPLTTLAELSQRVTNFVTTVWQGIDEIYMRLDGAKSDRYLMTGQLNVLCRDRCYHANASLLFEREAKVAREAWAQPMDASHIARFEVMTLRTMVLALQTKNGKLREADCR